VSRPTIEERIWEYIAQLEEDDDVDRIEDVGRAGINSLQIHTTDGRVIDVVVQDITEVL
jgi:hypothetical protein